MEISGLASCFCEILLLLVLIHRFVHLMMERHLILPSSAAVVDLLSLLLLWVTSTTNKKTRSWTTRSVRSHGTITLKMYSEIYRGKPTQKWINQFLNRARYYTRKQLAFWKSGVWRLLRQSTAGWMHLQPSGIFSPRACCVRLHYIGIWKLYSAGCRCI